MIETADPVKEQLKSAEAPSAQGPVHGLILSGGASRRMGRPKALLSYQETTFLGHLVDLLGPTCDTVTVVTGAHARLIEESLPPGVKAVRAKDWRLGMRASLRAGLAEIPRGPVLLTHVDRPTVSRQTVQLLGNCTVRVPVIPTYRCRSGHPVLIPDWFRERLMQKDSAPLRELIFQTGHQRLSVHDAGIVENINNPQDYARLRARG